MKKKYIQTGLLVSSLVISLFGWAADSRAASYEYDVKNQMKTAIIESGQKLIFTYDASGNITAIQVSTASTPAEPDPAAPKSQGSGIVLTWAALEGAAVYDVWRSTTQTPPVIRADSAVKVSTNLLETTWKDTSVQTEVVYYYWIQGKNGAGVGSLSPMITATYEPSAALSGTMLLLLND